MTMMNIQIKDISELANSQIIRDHQIMVYHSKIRCPHSSERRQPKLYQKKLDRDQYRAQRWQGQQGSLLYK